MPINCTKQLRLLVVWVTCAAHASSGMAQVKEQFDHALGSYLKGDYATSLPVFQALAQKGDGRAQAMVCESGYMGRGMKRSIEPLAECDLAVAARIPRAMGLIALYRLYGPDSFKDYAIAHNLALQGIAGNDPVSMRAMGDIYFVGLGQAKNYEESLKQYERAASLGGAQSSYMAAYQYIHGLGTNPDISRATGMGLRR